MRNDLSKWHGVSLPAKHSSPTWNSSKFLRTRNVTVGGQSRTNHKLLKSWREKHRVAPRHWHVVLNLYACKQIPANKADSECARPLVTRSNGTAHYSLRCARNAGTHLLANFYIAFALGKTTPPIPMEQVSFGSNDFATNPEPRCLCVLVLDTSGSMGGEPINQLNSGLVVLKDELLADVLAQKRVELSIVTFGPPTEIQTCITAENFVPPTLTAQNDTPMGGALAKALQIIKTRKQAYRAAGIKYYRPWIILITDGGPTDRQTSDWADSVATIRAGLDKKEFAFFPVGVDGADMETLASISPATAPLKLKGLRFRDLFKWLSSSLQSVSHSQPGEGVKLENPAAPAGWGTV